MLHGWRERCVHWRTNAHNSMYAMTSFLERKEFPDMFCDLGSPWDVDKEMMNRLGLEGMRSFEQVSVASKEGKRLLNAAATASSSAPNEEVPELRS